MMGSQVRVLQAAPFAFPNRFDTAKNTAYGFVKLFHSYAMIEIHG
jgi:hypothetical protein